MNVNTVGYRHLYNWCIAQFTVPAGGEKTFTLPDNLDQDRFDLSIVAGTVNAAIPAVGAVCIVRKDVDKYGNELRSLLEFIGFAKFVTDVIPNGEGNSVIKVFNQTPNVFIVKNTMDVDIVAAPFIDVLNQPVSGTR